jgi:hypothetical protein
MKYRTLLTAILVAISPTVFSYWDKAHENFALDTIHATSVKTAPLKNYYQNHLGFNMDRDHPFNNNENTINPFVVRNSYDNKPWLDIIGEGAKDEDYPLSRPPNHFYDPVKNHSLYQTLIDRDWETSVFMAEKFGTSTTNPNWALEDNGNILQQNYSLKDSQDLLYKALTENDKSNRDRALGEHLYALAHVLHLLTDMGQPEHVRNDSHLPIGEQNSLYEKYTDDVIKKNSKLFSTLYNNKLYHVDNTKFKTARQFWVNSGVNTGTGMGLSDFTNNNFVSQDTNFDTLFYVLPIKGSTKKESISDLYHNNPPKDIDGHPLVGDIEFIETAITDQQDGAASGTNARASSYSIFNREVGDRQEANYSDKCSTTIQSSYLGSGIIILPTCKVYTLNKWNYDKFHEILAPRVIGYGAAFLAHLHRGSMDIRPPSSNEFKELHIDLSNGYITQLPLRIANTTQNEDMKSGKLVAVVTYVDSSNNIVSVFKSNEITTTSTSNQHQAYTFKFPGQGFPLTMSEGTATVRVIFRGQLGQDKDTLVVAKKPTNELINTITINTDVPNEGVYALVDHNPQGAGFDSLKVKLSSTNALDGVIIPLVSHHVNYCYTDTLTGEFNVGGQSRFCASSTYRSDESFSITATQPSSILANSITATGTEHNLNLSTPIPFNATDLKIEYYHFPSDPAAPIGIGVTDISEPTFISFINSTDFTSYKSEFKSYQELKDILTLESSLIPQITPAAHDVEIIFGTQNSVSAKIEALDVARYSRIAVLTETNGFSLTYTTRRLDASNTNPITNTAWYPATVNQHKILENGTQVHEYPGYTKFRNVIAGVTIPLQYKPILPLRDPVTPGVLIEADPLILPIITEPAIASLIY